MSSIMDKLLRPKSASIFDQSSLKRLIKAAGCSYERATDGFYAIPASNQYCSYWISVSAESLYSRHIFLAAPLLPTPISGGIADFWQSCLSLNARLNAFAIGIEKDRIMLKGDFLECAMNPQRFREALTLFNDSHGYAFENILNEAERLGVAFPPMGE